MLLAEVLTRGRQYKIHQEHPTRIESMQGFKKKGSLFLIGRFKRRELTLFKQVIEIQM